MLPCHTIELIFQREITDTSSEVSDVCKALKLVEVWFAEQEYEFNPYFHDRKKGQEVSKESNKLLKKFGLFARIKRYFTKEEWSDEEGASRIMALSRISSSIVHSKFDSNLEFCAVAIETLDNLVVPNLMTQGKPSKNWLSIFLPQEFHDYMMSLNLYRFNDDTMEIAVSITSPDAYNDKDLQKKGEAYMGTLAESSRYLFSSRDSKTKCT